MDMYMEAQQARHCDEVREGSRTSLEVEQRMKEEEEAAARDLEVRLRHTYEPVLRGKEEVDDRCLALVRWEGRLPRRGGGDEKKMRSVCIRSTLR